MDKHTIFYQDGNEYFSLDAHGNVTKYANKRKFWNAVTAYHYSIGNTLLAKLNTLANLDKRPPVPDAFMDAFTTANGTPNESTDRDAD